jgi:hypothetical protein
MKSMESQHSLRGSASLSGESGDKRCAWLKSRRRVFFGVLEGEAAGQNLQLTIKVRLLIASLEDEPFYIGPNAQ